MGQAKLYGQQSGGLDINGIIQDYYVYANGNVKAGDFVEFINGVAGPVNYGTSTDTALKAEAYSGNYMSAVVLSDDKVLVLHSSSSKYYLYGIVCTINGATITKGADTQLSTLSYSGRTMTATLLTDENVFVVYESDGANGYLRSMILTISGTTITQKTDVAFSSSSKAKEGLASVLLSNGNVFVTHGVSGKLYGIVVSISGTTITNGTDTALSSNFYTAGYVSPVLLPSGKVFIAHKYGSSDNYLYSVVITINGTTITAGTDTAIVSEKNHARYATSILLPSGKVLIAHGDGGNDLWGIVVTINGTSITAGTNTGFGSNDSSAVGLSVALLKNGNVFISRTGEGTDYYYLYGTVLSISGTSITKESDTKLSSNNYSGKVTFTVLLSNETLFIAHSNTENHGHLYAQIFGVTNNIATNNVVGVGYETQVRPTTTPQFDGIAKTGGTGGTSTAHGEIVKIYTL